MIIAVHKRKRKLEDRDQLSWMAGTQVDNKAQSHTNIQAKALNITKLNFRNSD